MSITLTTYAKRARPVPHHLIGLDRVDLIGSGNVDLVTQAMHTDTHTWMHLYIL